MHLINKTSATMIRSEDTTTLLVAASPTLKTAVFGFIIGSVSSYFGYTTNKGSLGVGEAATKSVVVSSLLIIIADVLLIKCIYFLFPDTAI